MIFEVCCFDWYFFDFFIVFVNLVCEFEVIVIYIVNVKIGDILVSCFDIGWLG